MDVSASLKRIKINKILTERVGFEADCKRQYKDLMRHQQHSKCT